MGGGFPRLGSNIVMEYDIQSGKWDTLLPYKTWTFAMTAINHQLVLVGGWDNGASKALGVWGADGKAWTHPYPEMPTHSCCSAVVYNQWLVVTGGWDGENALSTIEVLNTGSKQWYAGPSTPIPWYDMKIAVMGDVGYFMGDDSDTGTVNVYCVSIQALIIHITSKASQGRDRQIWKEITGLQLTSSTPLSISGSLLAVGGEDNDGKAVTAFHLYQPDTGEWVKVGDLPSPCSECTCAMITDSEVLVAGGRDGQQLKRVDIALIA